MTEIKDEIIGKIIGALNNDKNFEDVFFDSMQELLRFIYKDYEVTADIDYEIMSFDVLAEKTKDISK